MSGISPEPHTGNGSGYPGVSVIIPTRNRKHFLSRAIDSVLSQNYPTLEIIVIDDASSDGTDELIRQYGDQVRYFYQKINRGPSAARNFAVAHSIHPFLAFLDSDDYWAPGRLETLMKAWSSLDDDYGIVANDISLFDDSDRHFKPKRLTPLSSGDISAKQLLIRNRFAPSAAIMSREAFDKCEGYDDSLLASEDRDLWIRASKNHRIYFINTPLTFMRKHPANISKEADRMQKSILSMLWKSFLGRILPRFQIGVWLKALSFGLFVIACLNNYERRQLRAWSFLTASCIIWPLHGKTRTELNEPTLFRVKIPAQRAGHWFGVYKTPGLSPQRGLSDSVVPTGSVIG